MTVSMLRRIVSILGTYIGRVTEKSIRENFSIVYQVCLAPAAMGLVPLIA